MSDKVLLKYIPHGINAKKFYAPTTDEELKHVAETRKKLFGNDEVDFVVLYNSRNLRRKSVGDVILAYQKFHNSLTSDQQKKVRLVMHTAPVDDNGTDLPAVIRDLAPEIKVVFSTDRIETDIMNRIYANSDVVICISSNEGYGLGTMEAILAEKMIVVNVTGGLQDQCGFQNDDGEILHEDREYTAEWGTNADGRYLTHGLWAEPVFPSNRSLIGSPPTPYIFDDRCRWEDAGDAIRRVYNLSPTERKRRGKLGRQFAEQYKFTAEAMCQGFIDGIDAVFEQWTPRQRFELIKG